MLQEVLARFGINVDTSQMTAAVTGMGGLAAAAVAAAAVIGGLLVRSLISLTSEMAVFGDEVQKTALQLGIGADELMQWQFAAERSGVPAAQLTGGLRRLQRNIVDAAEGSATAVRAFTDLGVSATNSDGSMRELSDIMPELADGFGGLETQTQRSARAQQLFGRAGAQLLPFFAEGSDGIAALQARFADLAGDDMQGFVDAAAAAQDATADWDAALLGMKITITREILPLMTSFVTMGAEVVAAIRRGTDGTNIWRNSLIFFGTIVGAILTGLAIKAVIAFAPFFAAIAVIVALGVVFDDLKTFVEGGDSAVGRLLDSIFGLGTSEAVVENINTAFEQWKAGVEGVTRAFNDQAPVRERNFAQWRSGLSSIGDWFRSFGPQITRSFSEWASGFETISIWTSSLIADLRDIVTWFGRVSGLVRGAAVNINAVTKSDNTTPDLADLVQAPSVRPGEGAGPGVVVEQTNSITVFGADLSQADVRRAVDDGIRDANERQNRAAQRSLVTGVR